MHRWMRYIGKCDRKANKMANEVISRKTVSAKGGELNLQFASCHYNDVIMTTMASQITSLTIVYSTVNSGADQRNHQSSASLAFVWGIHWDRWIPRTKGQLRGKCSHLMTSSWCLIWLMPDAHSLELSEWAIDYPMSEYCFGHDRYFVCACVKLTYEMHYLRR